MESIWRRWLVAATLLGVLAATLAAPAAPYSAYAAPAGVTAEESLDSQVVGGRDATAQEAAGSAALLARGYADARDALICGASLVAAEWALTAAHCVAGSAPGDLEVLAGTRDLAGGGKRLPVAEIRVHPDYEHRDAGWFADLALLRLARPAEAATIALAGPQHWRAWAPGADLTMLGWGEAEGREVSDHLQAATVAAESIAACTALLGGAFDAATILCGGPEGVGICHGDSGGPLVAGSGDTARQVGIASAGAEAGCGLAEPDTYTDVTAFGGWLRAESGSAVRAPVRAALRLHGTDRYATAAAISRQTFAQASVAYIATGEDFPDGLSAAPVAARRGAPLLLSAPEALPAATAAELRRLDPDGIIIVGGERALDQSVARQLRAIAPTTRVTGADRYTTAAELADQWSEDPPRQLVLATGEAFPDALAGVSLAARAGPLLLSRPEHLPGVTAGRIAALQPERVLLLGGEQAISAAVEARLRQIVPDAVIERISGATRFDTAAAIAVHPGHWPDPRLVYVATGSDFTDALAGGVAAGVNRAPMLLTRPNSLPEGTRAAAGRLGGRAVVLGGERAVDDGVARALEEHFRR